MDFKSLGFPQCERGGTKRVSCGEKIIDEKHSLLSQRLGAFSNQKGDGLGLSCQGVQLSLFFLMSGEIVLKRMSDGDL